MDASARLHACLFLYGKQEDLSARGIKHSNMSEVSHQCLLYRRTTLTIGITGHNTLPHSMVHITKSRTIAAW